MTTVAPEAVETAVSDVKPRPAPSRSPRRGRLLAGAILIAVCVAFLYPFAWLLAASLKPAAEVFDNKLTPDTVVWGNYAEIWRIVPIGLWLFNSVTIAVVAAAAATLSSAFVAFGFAHYRFPGRDLLFGLVLASMMLPAAVTMVPVFMEWKYVGLATTQVPLWAGNLFGSAFYIFLLRQFFLGQPRDQYEAAALDGAGPLRQFWSFAIPAVKPGLILVFLLEFKASWTDLMRPLIYLRDAELFTMPRGLKTVLDRFGGGGDAHWELVMAASVLATVPMILLFFAAQKYFLDQPRR